MFPHIKRADHVPKPRCSTFCGKFRVCLWKTQKNSEQNLNLAEPRISLFYQRGCLVKGYAIRPNYYGLWPGLEALIQLTSAPLWHCFQKCFKIPLMHGQGGFWLAWVLCWVTRPRILSSYQMVCNPGVKGYNKTVLPCIPAFFWYSGWSIRPILKWPLGAVGLYWSGIGLNPSQLTKTKLYTEPCSPINVLSKAPMVWIQTCQPRKVVTMSLFAIECGVAFYD